MQYAYCGPITILSILIAGLITLLPPIASAQFSNSYAVHEDVSWTVPESEALRADNCLALYRGVSREPLYEYRAAQSSLSLSDVDFDASIKRLEAVATQTDMGKNLVSDTAADVSGAVIATDPDKVGRAFREVMTGLGQCEAYYRGGEIFSQDRLFDPYQMNDRVRRALSADTIEDQECAVRYAALFWINNDPATKQYFGGRGMGVIARIRNGTPASAQDALTQRINVYGMERAKAMMIDETTINYAAALEAFTEIGICDRQYDYPLTPVSDELQRAARMQR